MTIAAATLAMTSGSAAAAPGIDEVRRQVAVPYAKREVATIEGRRALDRRIARAIWRVCDIDAGSVAYGVRAVNACRRTARASVAPQLAAIDATLPTHHAARNTLSDRKENLHVQ